jgi:hypothetical protein
VTLFIADQARKSAAEAASSRSSAGSAQSWWGQAQQQARDKQQQQPRWPSSNDGPVIDAQWKDVSGGGKGGSK